MCSSDLEASLTDSQKRALLQILRSFQAENLAADVGPGESLR